MLYLNQKFQTQLIKLHVVNFLLAHLLCENEAELYQISNMISEFNRTNCIISYIPSNTISIANYKWKTNVPNANAFYIIPEYGQYKYM